MRALIGLTVVLMLTGCSLLIGTPEPRGTPGPCPAALLQGRLAADGEGGALVIHEFGPQPVRWPQGYTVDAGPPVVLRDAEGRPVATAGDMVFVGGGMNGADTVFIACGDVQVESDA